MPAPENLLFQHTDERLDALSKEPLVRVYNRSARSHTWLKWVVIPRGFSSIPKSVAESLQSRYPEEIVEAGVAQKELNGATAELAETKELLAKAAARIAELEAKAAGKGGASILKEKDARIAELESQLEQLTAPAPRGGGPDDVV